MKSFLNKLFSFWPLFVLLIIEIFLFRANYIAGTWLIGWDSTQPELNIRENLFRSFNAIWQEYRGLGLLDGMAHSANLVHLGYVFLLSLFLPDNFIRYVFTFLMHFLGGAGAYFLTTYFLKGTTGIKKQMAGLVGASFYLFNPGTIQMFYTPLELFIVHFGFLPWLLLTLIDYLKSGSKRKMLLLFILNILAVSQSHVPTIFIVYGISAGFILLINVLKNLKRVIIAIALLFSANAFWGLPYIYSAINTSDVITNSKINILSNPEIVLRNRTFGDLKNTILLRGFSLDYQDWGKEERYGYQMEPWRNHLSDPGIEKIGYILFGFSILGILLSLIHRKKEYLPFVIIFGFSFANLGTEIPYLASVREFLIRNIPLYEEIFRFTFTKFVIIYSLCISIFLTFVLDKLFHLLKFRPLIILVGSAFFAGIIFVSKPSFIGNFIYEALKVKVPAEYFEVFNFFNKNSEGRIALMPQPILWGWEYLRWGYRGSGFVWQGIRNPVLHRSFDPWSAYNETYYQELSNSYYLKDSDSLDNTFKKYKVEWILLDENIFLPGGWDESDYLSWFKDYLANSGHFTKEGQFGGLTIYKTAFSNAASYIDTPYFYVGLDSDLKYSKIDPLFSKYKTYFYDSEGITYPFVNLDNRSKIKVSRIGEVLQIESNRLKFFGKKNLSVSPNENSISVSPQNKTVKVEIPIKNAITEDFSSDRGEKNPRNCDILKTGSVNKERIENGILYSASMGGVSCDFFEYPSVLYDQGYVLRVSGENKQGRGLKIYLQNTKLRRIELEEVLPKGSFDEYFFLLSKKLDGGGYSLNLETRSFGKIPSSNFIRNIEFIPVPTEWLNEIQLVPEESIIETNNIQIKNVKKYGTWMYKVEVSGNGLLTLGQGYEEGWKAFSIPNYQFFEHVKVNSWSNGWMIPAMQPSNNLTIYIFYWPQLLEYLGFAILVVTLFVIILTKGERRDYNTN